MALEIVQQRRRQRRITQLALGGAIAFHVLLFVFLRATGLDVVLVDKVVDMVEAIAPPPPPPPPPPDVKANIKAPPPIDLNFSVQNMTARPSVDAAFDAGLLNFQLDMEAPDLTMSAMEFSTSDLTNLVSNAQLPVMNLMKAIDFDIGVSTSEDDKGSASGFGKRTSGKVALTILDIPGDDEKYPWDNGELENLEDFISKNSNLKAGLGARAIAFTGNWASFDLWLSNSKTRTSAAVQELSEIEPENNGLNIIANMLPLLDDKNYEGFKTRFRKLMTDYLRIKFEVRIKPEEGKWEEKIAEMSALSDWQKEYLREGQKSFLQVYEATPPSGKELKGIYLMLRTFELMQLPILFCEPRGVPGSLLPENLRMLRTYVNNGGFIYFTNASTLNKSKAIRGLITELTNEKLTDANGEKTLAKLKGGDQPVSGYDFRDPDPAVFHPWTFFPMIIPRYTSVNLTIYNRIGNVVFADTLKNMAPGAYLQKNRHYRWKAVDNQGNPVESGYYIYQLEADLFRKTGPMRVSVLRQLPNGKHGIFSSFFNISEVPSTETVQTTEMPYGERGVFGVSIKGRLAICYTEGYAEKKGMTSSDNAAKENALRWFTNVVIFALSEGSLAR